MELTRNGAVFRSLRTDFAFALNPYTPLGYSNNIRQSAELKDVAGSLPAYAQLGSGGSLGQLRLFSGPVVVMADIDRNWTLEPSSGPTALACINDVIQERLPTAPYTNSACLRIDLLGNVLGVKYTIRVEDKTLVFQ